MALLDLAPRQILRSTPAQLDLRLIAWRKRRAIELADLRYGAWFNVAYARTRVLPPLREVAALSLREAERYRASEQDAYRRWRQKMADLQTAARQARARAQEKGDET